MSLIKLDVKVGNLWIKPILNTKIPLNRLRGTPMPLLSRITTLTPFKNTLLYPPRWTHNIFEKFTKSSSAYGIFATRCLFCNIINDIWTEHGTSSQLYLYTQLARSLLFLYHIIMYSTHLLTPGSFFTKTILFSFFLLHLQSTYYNTPQFGLVVLYVVPFCI